MIVSVYSIKGSTGSIGGFFVTKRNDDDDWEKSYVGFFNTCLRSFQVLQFL